MYTAFQNPISSGANAKMWLFSVQSSIHWRVCTELHTVDLKSGKHTDEYTHLNIFLPHRPYQCAGLEPNHNNIQIYKWLQLAARHKDMMHETTSAAEIIMKHTQ